MKAATCLDCTVLPPWSIVLCPMHAAAERMLELTRLVARGASQPFDHPDARALARAGEEARAILRELERRP